MSEFTSMGEVLGYLGTFKIEDEKGFSDLVRKLGDGRKVKITIQYEDPRQDWIDKWHSRAMNAESLGEVNFAFVKDRTICIDCAQGNIFAVAAPRKGDKYDRKTGIAVAFAEISGEKIPEYI